MLDSRLDHPQSGKPPSGAARPGPPRRRRPGLRGHLFAILLAALLPAIVTAAVAVWGAAEAHQRAYEARLHDTARALRMAVNADLAGRVASLEAFAAAAFGEGRGLEEVSAAQPKAGRVAAATGMRILVGDAEGQLLLQDQVPPGAPLPPPGDLGAALRRAARQARPVISNLLRGPAPAVALAVPVPPAQGGPADLSVGGAVEAAHFDRLLAAQGLEAGTIATLIDAAGVVLARSDGQERGHVLAPEVVTLVGEATGAARRRIGLDGQDRLFASAGLGGGAGWTVVVSSPYAAYHDSWARPQLGLAVGTALALLLAGAMVLALARRVLRPVHSLAGHARAVALDPEGQNGTAADLEPAPVAEFEALRQGFAAAEAALHFRAEAEHLAYAALAEKEAMLAGAQALTGVGGWTWDVREAEALEAGLLRWTEETWRIFGLPPQGVAVPTALFFDAIPAVDQAHVRERLETALRQRSPCRMEHRIRRPDGSIRLVEEFASPELDAEGRVSRLVGSCQDVTDRRMAEAALADNAERLRDLLATLDLAPFLARDPDGTVRFWSAGCERLFGWSAAEALGRRLNDLLGTVFPVPVGEIEAALEHRGEWTGELRHRRRDGEELVVAVRKALRRDAAGRPVAVVESVTDITALREAQEALAENEALFRATFEQAAVGIAHVALDGTWLRVNDRLCAITGHPREVLLELTFQDITHPEDLAADLAQVRALVAGRIDTYSIEKRYLRADGTTVWVNLTVSLLRDAVGRPKHFVSITEDIDARRHAEAALAESSARYRTLFQRMEEGFALWEAVRGADGGIEDFVLLERNDAMHRLTGRMPEGCLGRRMRELVPDMPPDWFAAHVRVAEDGAPVTVEEQARSNQLWLNKRLFRPGPERVAVLLRDVTDRVEALAAVRESEAMLRRVLDNLFSFVGLLAPDGTLLDANRAPAHSGGTALPAARGRPFWEAGWWSHDPGVQRRIRDACLRAAAGEAPRFDTELRLMDHERLAVDFQVAPLRDAAGKVTHLVASAVDITERKRSEEAKMLLAREVDHRAKNALAVVQSVLSLTRTDDPGEFKEAVKGRIAAMALAQTLLAGERWHGADLRRLLTEQLAAYRGGGGLESAVQLDGPLVGLAPDAVQPVAMAVHELATNAARYGALSAPGGRVTVTWAKDPASGGLALLWREQGGPRIEAEPARRGLGFSLMRTTVVRQLQGTLEMQWETEGLRCAITLPARQVQWRPRGGR